MRIFAAILGIAVVLLQYRVWMSEHGAREVSRLSAEVDAQAAANLEQRERNRQLAAEVTDLKVGLTALEERARSELGMVGSNETFYQVVSSGAAQSPEQAGQSADAPASRPNRPQGLHAPAPRRPDPAPTPAAHAAITARAQ